MKKIVVLILVALLVIGGVSVVAYNQIKLAEQKKQVQQLVKTNESTLFVYINPGVPESQTLVLKNLLESQSWVQSVQYVSADQMLSSFKAKHQNDQATLQAIDELNTNPLGAQLTIITTAPSQKAFLDNFIQTNNQSSIVDKTTSYGLVNCGPSGVNPATGKCN